MPNNKQLLLSNLKTIDPYAKDLHRKGELNKVEAMEKLAKQMERQSNNGLASAFVTEGVNGFDGFCMLAQSQAYSNKQGYILYNEQTNEAVFIIDDEK